MKCLSGRKLTRKKLRIFGDVVGTSLTYAVLINLVVQIKKKEKRNAKEHFIPPYPAL